MTVKLSSSMTTAAAPVRKRTRLERCKITVSLTEAKGDDVFCLRFLNQDDPIPSPTAGFLPILIESTFVTAFGVSPRHLPTTVEVAASQADARVAATLTFVDESGAGFAGQVRTNVPHFAEEIKEAILFARFIVSNKFEHGSVILLVPPELRPVFPFDDPAAGDHNHKAAALPLMDHAVDARVADAGPGELNPVAAALLDEGGRPVTVSTNGSRLRSARTTSMCSGPPRVGTGTGTVQEETYVADYVVDFEDNDIVITSSSGGNLSSFLPSMSSLAGSSPPRSNPSDNKSFQLEKSHSHVGPVRSGRPAARPLAIQTNPPSFRAVSASNDWGWTNIHRGLQWKLGGSRSSECLPVTNPSRPSALTLTLREPPVRPGGLAAPQAQAQAPAPAGPQRFSAAESISSISLPETPLCSSRGGSFSPLSSASSSPSSRGDDTATIAGSPTSPGTAMETVRIRRSGSRPEPSVPLAPETTTADNNEDDMKVYLAIVGVTFTILVNLKDINSSWRTEWRVLFGFFMMLSVYLAVSSLFAAVSPAGSLARTFSASCARLGLLVAAALFIVSVASQLGHFGSVAGVLTAAVFVLFLAVLWRKCSAKPIRRVEPATQE